MANYYSVLWAVIPTLLFLWIYYNRTPSVPPLLQTLLAFWMGVIFGFLALGLEYLVEFATRWQNFWYHIKHFFPGSILRQLVEVAPIEEGCKFVAVLALLCYLQRRYKLRSTTVFFFTIAVSLGFTAEENWIYLDHGESSIVERIISTPVHAMLSAPWAYALGIYVSSGVRLRRHQLLIAWAFGNSVLSHALVNVLAIAGSYYPHLLYLLSYSLFPLLLWMFWRLERLFRQVQGKPTLRLISGKTWRTRYWQRSLILLSLILGGNGIFGWLMISKKLDNLQFWQILKPHVFWYVIQQSCLNVILAILAWLIYRYLRYLVRREDAATYY